MKKIMYTGRADLLILDKEDFDKADIDQERLEFPHRAGVEVQDKVAKVLLSIDPDESPVFWDFPFAEYDEKAQAEEDPNQPTLPYGQVLAPPPGEPINDSNLQTAPAITIPEEFTTVPELEDWVGDDVNKAKAVLQAEETQGEDARSTLIASLQKIIDSESGDA